MPTPKFLDILYRIQTELRWLMDVIGSMSSEEIRETLADIERRLKAVLSEME